MVLAALSLCDDAISSSVNALAALRPFAIRIAADDKNFAFDRVSYDLAFAGVSSSLPKQAARVTIRFQSLILQILAILRVDDAAPCAPQTSDAIRARLSGLSAAKHDHCNSEMAADE